MRMHWCIDQLKTVVFLSTTGLLYYRGIKEMLNGEGKYQKYLQGTTSKLSDMSDLVQTYVLRYKQVTDYIRTQGHWRCVGGVGETIS